MKRANELRQAIGTATDELQGLTGDAVAFEAKEKEIVGLEGELIRTVTAEQRAAALGAPVRHDTLASPALIAPPSAGEMESGYFSRGIGAEQRGVQNFGEYVRAARRKLSFGFDPNLHYRTFGEQLQSIAKYYLSNRSDTDSRLVRAPTGAGEVDPTGGGFLVQQDFMQAIFMLAHEMGEILSRVNPLPIGANSNGLKINAVDETSRATGSRWGGVQSYWVGEGQTAPPTKPKLRRLDFNLHKLLAFMYMTDELLQDSDALTSLAAKAFSEEVMFMTEDAIFEGSGVGLPLGILNSQAKVTIPKVSGQATGTILKANIDQMWSQLWIRSYKNAVWLINQEIWTQLSGLNAPVGSAGGQLVYMPPGGLSASPYAALMGRPVIPIEYASALGTEGDIVLADLSQYTLIEKGGLQAATSMHVAFLTDESVFRITYRVDGKPMWTKALTPFKGSTAKSPFITLQSRP